MIIFLDIASKAIPNFAGIKYSKYDANDFGKCLHYEQGSKNILFGVDEKLIDSLAFGATGWVGSTYNHLSPLYYKLISSYKNRELEKVNDLQAKALLFVETLDKLCSFNGAGKSFVQVFRLDMGPSRYPPGTMTENQLQQALKILASNGVTPYLSQSI